MASFILPLICLISSSSPTMYHQATHSTSLNFALFICPLNGSACGIKEAMPVVSLSSAGLVRRHSKCPIKDSFHCSYYLATTVRKHNFSLQTSEPIFKTWKKSKISSRAIIFATGQKTHEVTQNIHFSDKKTSPQEISNWPKIPQGEEIRLG